MYRHHFGLTDKPFQIAPSPKFLYPSETHDESRARVLYGIREARGFAVVHGRVGLGKTTVLLSVLEELEASVRTAFIFHPVRDFQDLLRMVLHEYGMPSRDRDEVQLLQDLNNFLIERLAMGEKCVLIIDEAQNLSIELLERIRTLSNLQTEESSLLQIVLVGQPELRDKLMDDQLVQLRQRVGIWHEIEPLNLEETEDYILHRLRLAGARRPKEIMPPPVCARVHELTGGVPRVINQLCDTALLIAFGRDVHTVLPQHVEEAALELHLSGATTPPSAQKRKSKRPTTPPTSPVLRPALRYALIAAAFLVALAGVVWFTQGSPFWQRLTEGKVVQPLVSMGVADDAGAAAPLQSEPFPAAIQETPVQPDETRAGLDARLENIARWRAAGVPVYAVHLHSFKERSRAEEFARQLQSSLDWDQPLYVERTGSNTVWYRVLAGGFEQSSEARDWIQRLRQRGDVGYAQLMPLPNGANPLLPLSDATERGVSG